MACHIKVIKLILIEINMYVINIKEFASALCRIVYIDKTTVCYQI